MMNLFTVETAKPIIGMNINGPLTTPTKMDEINVRRMVSLGYTVYKHNPHDINDKIKVTLENMKHLQFSTSSIMLNSIKNNIKPKNDGSEQASDNFIIKTEHKSENTEEKPHINDIDNEIEVLSEEDTQPVNEVVDNKVNNKKNYYNKNSVNKQDFKKHK